MNTVTGRRGLNLGAEDCGEVVRSVDEDVGRGDAESVRRESVGDSAGPEAGVTSGKDVDRRITDDYCFGGLGVGFFQNAVHAVRIGLLRGKAVASVHVKEEIVQAEGFDDSARGNDRLVREHGHFPEESIGAADNGEHFFNAVVDMRVVELVGAVVGEKKFEGFFYDFLVLGIAERTAYEHGSAVADVGSDHVAWEFGALHEPQHRVDGMNEVKARVDQGAIEIEDQELDRCGVEVPSKADHTSG